MSSFALGIVAVALFGFGILHYVTVYRFWLSLVQRASSRLAYLLFVSIIAVGIDVLAFRGEYILQLIFFAVFFLMGLPVGLYFYEKGALKTVEKIKMRAERAQEQGRQDLADFNMLCIGRLLIGLGKLKELKRLRFTEK